MTPEMEREYIAALGAALTAGDTLLKNGHTALEAVEAAIKSMEDSPLFNAGKGSVFTHNGKMNWMRQSWMEPPDWPEL